MSAMTGERGPLAAVFALARLPNARLRMECAWMPPQPLESALASVASDRGAVAGTP